VFSDGRVLSAAASLTADAFSSTAAFAALTRSPKLSPLPGELTLPVCPYDGPAGVVPTLAAAPTPAPGVPVARAGMTPGAEPPLGSRCSGRPGVLGAVAGRPA
jgi:hypothetical protein